MLLRAPQSLFPASSGRRVGIIGNNGAVIAGAKHSGRSGGKEGGADRGRRAKGERKDNGREKGGVGGEDAEDRSQQAAGSAGRKRKMKSGARRGRRLP